MSWLGALLPASLRRELEIRRWRRARARWDRPFQPVPADADIAALGVHRSSRPAHLAARLTRGGQSHPAAPARGAWPSPARPTLAADCVSGARLWSLVRRAPAPGTR